MKLSQYVKGDYSPGASMVRQVFWYFIGTPLVFSSLLPFSSLKIFLLRIFGAKIGTGVRIKPGVRIKFPWKLSVGDYSWIGEGVWIDNLAHVTIGSNCCVSQGAYFCTGNHDWSKPTFDLKTQAITIEDHCWIAAQTSLSPGSILREGVVLTLGSVAAGELSAWTIHTGNPCVATSERSRT